MNAKPLSELCPFCANVTEVSTNYVNRHFFQCGRCDLIFVSREQHVDLPAERERYLRHQNSRDNPGYVEMLKSSVDLLRRVAPNACDILDYGAGPTPVLVELLNEAGLKAMGYDPLFSPDTDLSNSFDAILSIETWEHFRQPRETISHIVSLLRLGGCLIVQTQLHGGLESINGWWYARDKTHVAFYSQKTMQFIAQCFGLDVDGSHESTVIVFRKCVS